MIQQLYVLLLYTFIYFLHLCMISKILLYSQYSCEGSCLRSFHATIEAGAESLCDSLRLSDAEVEVRSYLFLSFICLFCFCLFSCNHCGWCLFFPNAFLLNISDINSANIGWCRQCKHFYAQIVNINNTSALLVGNWVPLINLLVLLRFDLFLLDFLFLFIV